MALIICTSVPLATVATILAWFAYSSAADQSFDRIQHTAAAMREVVSRKFEKLDFALEAFSASGFNEQTLTQTFHSFLRYNADAYCELVVERRDGGSVFSYLTTRGNDKRCPGWQRNSKKIHEQLRLVDKALVNSMSVTMLDTRPYFVFKKNVEYRRLSGKKENVTFLAVAPVSDDDLMLHTRMLRLNRYYDDSFVDFWLAEKEMMPVSFSETHTRMQVWTPSSLERLKRSFVSDKAQRYQEKDIYYYLAQPIGSLRILVTTVRSNTEWQALRLFVARVMLIFLLLGIELLIVALAAHRYIVEPMEKLAKNVNGWRIHGVFKPDLPDALPLELRHMEQAFEKATKRIDRHEARLKRVESHQRTLIGEIHHRVKNNLQIVASLVSMQANRIISFEVKEEFDLIRGRVRALALVHQHMHHENGQTYFALRDFFEEFLNKSQFPIRAKHADQVTLTFDVESLVIMPNQAVPLALFTSEIVTNACLHAFPEQGVGNVHVSLTQADREAILLIKDDGIGLESSQTHDKTQREGIGSRLIKGLVNQLHGQLSISVRRGTEYHLRFPLQAALKPIPKAHKHKSKRK